MAKNYPVLFHRLAAMSLPEIMYRLRNNLIAHKRKFFSSPQAGLLTPEQFLKQQRLIHPTKPIAEQVTDLLDEFRSQAVLPWQKDPADDFFTAFNGEFPEEKKSVVDAADGFCQHRFQFFDQALAFGGEIDWHYDPLMKKSVTQRYYTDIPYWHENVVRGVKYVWELNRHQHFVALAQTYRLSKDRRYAAELFRQWQHWLQTNPYPYGVNWCSSLEAGLRLISWTWALQLAKHSSYLTPLFYTHILQSIEQHADHIADHLSLYSSANNHLLGEAVGLIYAGCYYPHLRHAAEWRRTGFAIFFREFFRQVLPDGVTSEQTTHYQLYVFQYALLTLLAAEQTEQPLPLGFQQRMEKMAEFVSALLDDSGNLPAIGDEDGGQVLRLHLSAGSAGRTLLSNAALLFKRGVFKEKACALHPDTVWLLGLPAIAQWQQVRPEKDERRLIHFPDGGYAVVHCAVNERAHYLVFDAGPLGLDRMASHGHADALSLILSVAGQPVLIDSGTYTYQGEPGWRDFFRSTLAHNSVVVDGKNQSEIVGPFQWGNRAQARFLSVSEDQQAPFMVAEHDGYRKLGVTHQRSVRLDGDQWNITDSLQGKGRRQVLALWHLASGEAVMMSPDHMRLTLPGLLVDFHIRVSAPAHCRIRTADTSPVQGWYSPGFGVKKGNPVLCITTFNPLPVEIVTQIEFRTP